MKKYFCISLIVISLVIAGCASTPAGVSSADKAAIDAVAQKWVDSLKSEDIDGLISTYWEDSVHLFYDIDGSSTRYNVEEIRIEQQKLFDEFDMFADLNYLEPERDFTSEPDSPIYTYTVEMGDFGFQDIFQFIKRNGQWKIIDHIYQPLP